VSSEFVAAERARVLALLARKRDLAYAENDRGWRSSVQVDVGCELWDSAGRGLQGAAEATDADLIVVGSSRRGLLGLSCSAMTRARRWTVLGVRWRSRRLGTRASRGRSG
jgi:nucleotide-binding universal stress UspA family protein